MCMGSSRISAEAWCRYLCFSYWSLHLFSAGWITATVCWLTCRPVSSSVCNPFRMQQPDLFTTWGDLIIITDALISLHWLRVPERRLTWLLSLLTLLTCLTDERCDPSFCLPTVSSRAFPTAYQMISPPLRSCEPSCAIWRHTYSAAVTTLDWYCLYLHWV